MIREVRADLFDLGVDCYAHGCNIQGIMNAGIAKAFRERYPAMYKEYKGYCRTGNFHPGEVHFYRATDRQPHVINIATQFDMKSSARLEYIEQGLLLIEKCYPEWKINSLAMPHIGCGLGSLKWGDVKEVVKKVFGTSDLEVLVASIPN